MDISPTNFTNKNINSAGTVLEPASILVFYMMSFIQLCTIGWSYRTWYSDYHGFARCINISRISYTNALL